MDKIECTTTEREALHSWRFHHPHPRVQRNMEALSLLSHGLAPEDIARLRPREVYQATLVPAVKV